MTSVMRPDPRYELALASQVPHTQTEHPDTSAVAVTEVIANAFGVLLFGWTKLLHFWWFIPIILNSVAPRITENSRKHQYKRSNVSS